MDKISVSQLPIKNDPKEKAIAYLRVSTEDQKKDGHSIDSQKVYATKYAQKHKYEIIQFVEEYESASKVKFDDIDYENNLYTALKNRPQLLKIITSVNQSKFKHLIVSTRDRLARNLEVYVGIKLFLQKKGIELHFANPSESMNIENKGLQKFIELVFGSIAELEANLISDRARDGLAQKVRDGYWPAGYPPYGYVTECINPNAHKKKRILIPLLNEQKYIEEIFRLHNQYGYSYRKIAKILNEQNNTSYWNKSKIESIITNETYTGKIAWGKRSRRSYDTNNESLVYSSDEKCSAFITTDQWEQAKNIRHKKVNMKDSKYYSTPFLLRDKLACGNCGTILKAKNYGFYKNGTPREGVYRCDCTRKLKKNEKMILKKSIIEEKFIDEFLANLSPEKTNIMWYYYSKTRDRILKENEDKIKRIDEELTKKSQHISKLDALIQCEDNETILEALKVQRPILQRELDILKSYKDELNAITANSFKAESDLVDALKKLFKQDFKHLSNERKRMIIDMLIDKVVVTKMNDDLKLTIYMTTNINIL
ncbi:MAG: recombinase family protein [Marinisporobacter sp.]|jgi:DNA invertase Pin-like site-specific DNA recombinase|nr:recombinase family protein [Marinisporobacter sp.]